MSESNQRPLYDGLSRDQSVAIAVATYQRQDGLKRLLESVDRLNRPANGWSLDHVIVVDNDPSGSAEEVVKRESANRLYVCEPQPGISAARNQAVESARSAGANWIAFIDDDETVTPSWLYELTDAADRTGADAVIGAVRYHCPADTPAWFSGLGVFEDQLVDGPQSGWYFTTNNLLLRVDPWPVVPPLFDLRFGLTGGSDHHLGARLRAKGASIAYAPRAFADEIVLPERVNLRSALRRLLRNGNVMVRVEMAVAAERGGSELVVRLRGCLAAAARVMLGGIRMLTGLPRGTRGVADGVRTCTIGIGQFIAAIGGTVEEYRRVDQPA